MEKERNTPSIRFKGFTDPWEQRKLGEVCNQLKRTINPQDTPNKRFSEYSMPAYDAHKIPNIVLGTSLNSARKIIDRPCLLINKLNVRKKRIWNIGKPEMNAVCSTEFIPVYSDNANLKFLEYLASSDKFTDYLENLSSGSSNSQKRVTPDSIMSAKVCVSSLNEQKQIGEYFEKIDALITLHQRKIDYEKRVKEYLLQNMFSREGENVPRIRFPGFTDPWEQSKLGELVTIERGGSPRPIDAYITDAQDGLNWVKIGDAPEQGRYITHTKEKIKPSGLSKTRRVFPGDLILSNSMSFGRPYIMSIPGCIHDGWLLIRNNQNAFDLKFLCQMLGTNQMLTQYKQLAAGSTVNNLNKELVANAIVKVPKKDEQDRIGAFLGNLDSLIALHQRKLERLQELKKGFLQKMFV